DRQAGAQHGAVGTIEAEQCGRSSLAQAPLDAVANVAAGPGGAEALAFDRQECHLVQGVHGPQSGVELEAVDYAHRMVEPDVLGPQVAMAVDDALTQRAGLEGAPVLGCE